MARQVYPRKQVTMFSRLRTMLNCYMCSTSSSSSLLTTLSSWTSFDFHFFVIYNSGCRCTFKDQTFFGSMIEGLKDSKQFLNKSEIATVQLLGLMVSRKASWCCLFPCHHLLPCLLRSVHFWPGRQYLVFFRVHANPHWQSVDLMLVLFQLAPWYPFAWTSQFIISAQRLHRMITLWGIGIHCSHLPSFDEHPGRDPVCHGALILNMIAQ